MIFAYALSFVIFAVMILYSWRHYRFLKNRLFERTDMAHQDLAGHYLPTVSIMIPMHNEIREAEEVVACLSDVDYPSELLEIVAIDDHSTDGTAELLDKLASEHPRLKVRHRRGGVGGRGKSQALATGTEACTGEILLVFDADYRPGRDLIKRLVAPFTDPSVGAVMGRVVPSNSGATTLTRLLDIERSGGYQTNQQARQNLGLIVQYGGTVGGVRASILNSVGGWRPHLTEDTDLTFRLYLSGFRVSYVNLAECYEQAVQNWRDRAKQLRRWAMGHNQCLFDHLRPLLRSPLLTRAQKVDGVMLLGSYVLPLILLVGWFSSIVIYLFGDLWYWSLFTAVLGTTTYNAWGNLAVFGEIGSALILDGRGGSILLLPLAVFSFFANVWICSGAFLSSVKARVESRVPRWDKTPRYETTKVR